MVVCALGPGASAGEGKLGGDCPNRGGGKSERADCQTLMSFSGDLMEFISRVSKG